MVNNVIATLLLLVLTGLVGCHAKAPPSDLNMDTTVEPAHTHPAESAQAGPDRSLPATEPGNQAPVEADAMHVEQAKALYETADRKRNEAYARLRKTLSSREWDDFRDKQRSWIDYRDYFCGEVLRRDLNDPTMTDDQLYNTVEYWRRMRQMTEERTWILRAISDGRRYADSDWTGRWIDGRGGCLLILERDDGIFFELQVVRGPTHHIGGIAGHAAVNGQIARFDDRRPPEPTSFTSGPTWLTFTNTFISRARRLQVFSANTLYYHGARAYFDGIYYRVADLTADERARLPRRTHEGAPLTP